MILSITHVTCFAQPLEESDLLSFCGNIYGGVIGGGFAVYVLKRTLLSNQERDQREHQLHVMPYLTYRIVNPQIVESKEYIDVFDVRHLKPVKCLQFELEIGNLGMGNAISIKLSGWEVLNQDGRNLFIMQNDDIDDMQGVSNGAKVEKAFCISLPSYERYDEENGQNELLRRTVYYKDILGNVYKDIIEMEFYRIKYWIGDSQVEQEGLKIIRVQRPVQNGFD